MGQSVKQCRSYRLSLGIAVCALVVVLAGSPAGVAQQAAARATGTPGTGTSASAAVGAARAANANVAAEEEETAKPGKPGGEGIKIHGHWVLQVKNVDGTLGERREFNNSLVTAGAGYSSGDQLLAALFSGSGAVGDPGVAFISPTGLPNPADPTTWCSVVASGAASPNCGVLTTTPQGALSLAAFFQQEFNGEYGLTATANFTPNVSWVLSGNYTVPSSFSQIGFVQTLVPLCVPPKSSYIVGGGFPATLAGSAQGRGADLSPAGCAATGTNYETVIFTVLTSTAVRNNSGVASPLPVSPGQIITVTVTITFS